MIKNLVLSLVVGAFASTAAMAATKGVSLSQDKKIVFHAPNAHGVFTPNFIHKPKAATIFSNIATDYPKGLYFAGEGLTLCGPDCGIGESIEVGGGFTPTASATATEVDAAVGYIEGADEITLAIFSDSSGAPGKALWSGVAKSLPTFGECCGLATAKIKGGLALTAGTPYWVVVYTDKKETTTFAAWNLQTVDQVDGAPVAYNDNDTSWTSYSSTQGPAFAVYSK